MATPRSLSDAYLYLPTRGRLYPVVSEQTGECYYLDAEPLSYFGAKRWFTL